MDFILSLKQNQILYQNFECTSQSVINIVEDSKDNIIKIIDNPTLCEVKLHIGNLPNGHKPSPEKIAEAIRLGILLGEHQTIVDSHFNGLLILLQNFCFTVFNSCATISL